MHTFRDSAGMSFGNYTPQPVDATDITHPYELYILAEEIAKNVHEVWSAGRMRDGLLSPFPAIRAE